MSDYDLAIPAELQSNIERYAVYRCYSEQGVLLYVGESGELGRRLAAHAQKIWFLEVRGITLEWHADELSALNAERRAIHVENPRYNIQGKSKPAVRTPPKTRRGRRPVTEASAERYYADAIAAGKLPSKRRIQSDLHVGQERAKALHEHLARQLRGGQVVPMTRRA